MTVSVLWPFLTVPWVRLNCVIVVYPEADHIHLHFCNTARLMLPVLTAIADTDIQLIW